MGQNGERKTFTFAEMKQVAADIEEVPEKDYAKVDTREHMAAYLSERL